MNKCYVKCGLLTAVLLLAGCSPHPGAGVWVTPATNPEGIGRILVMYEGRAELYALEAAQAKWRCFWSGRDRQTIAMDCVLAEDTREQAMFTLETLSSERANLFREGVLVEQFTRSAEPPDVSR